MSAKEQKKLQKKKEREKNVKLKKIRRQAILTKKRQEEAADFKKEQRVKKIQKEMGDLSIWGDEVLLKMSEENLSTLEKNCQILKALESEHKKELAKKQELNENLEEEGFLTLEEKINALHQKMLQKQKKEVEDFKDRSLISEDDASSLVQEVDQRLADLGIKFNTRSVEKPLKETAEVSVIKSNSEQNS